MRLKHDLHIEEGVKKIVPLFPEISENTDFYIFRHPQGLLYATQFTQVFIRYLFIIYRDSPP
jgi:fatty acid synthase subunit beta